MNKTIIKNMITFLKNTNLDDDIFAEISNLNNFENCIKEIKVYSIIVTYDKILNMIYENQFFIEPKVLLSYIRDSLYEVYYTESSYNKLNNPLYVTYTEFIRYIRNINVYSKKESVKKFLIEYIMKKHNLGVQFQFTIDIILTKILDEYYSLLDKNFNFKKANKQSLINSTKSIPFPDKKIKVECIIRNNNEIIKHISFKNGIVISLEIEEKGLTTADISNFCTASGYIAAKCSMNENDLKFITQIPEEYRKEFKETLIKIAEENLNQLKNI